MKEKMQGLILKKQENIEEVKVPDLKQYLVNGYEEIRQVKNKNKYLEEELEKQSKNEQLYKATLVTLDEFRRRDDDNKKEIERLGAKLQEKDEEIHKLNDKLNTYKIRETELKKEEIEREREILLAKEKERKDVINSLSCTISNIKGNLSKDKVLEIINKK